MSDEEIIPDGYTLTIDGLEYRTSSPNLTAAQVRALPHPPIGPEYDLWLARPDGPDEFLTNDKEISLTEAPTIFTAPRAINPGR